MSEVYSGTATRAWQVVLGCSPNMPCAPRCWAVKTVNRLANSPNAKVREAHEGLVADRMVVTMEAAEITETSNLVKVNLHERRETALAWTGIVRLNEAHLTDPLRHRKPEAYAVGYHADWARLADSGKDRMFAVMALARWHEYRLLSKQPAAVREYLRDKGVPGGNPDNDLYGRLLNEVNVIRGKFPKMRLGDIPVSNPARFPPRWIRLGFSLMAQADADAALPHARALADAGWKIWVSMEPQIGPIDLRGWEFLTWVVVGSESGPRARPFNENWARNTRDFCQRHGIPLFYKQRIEGGEKIEHPFLDGRQWTEQPEAHG